MTPEERSRLRALRESFQADADDDIMDNLTVMEVRDVRWLLDIADAADEAEKALEANKRWIFRGCDEADCPDGACVDYRNTEAAIARLRKARGA